MSREIGETAVDNILAHVGVKGMRWGVRRKATVGAQEVVISDKRIGKGIKTSGGKGHPTSSDAASARTIGQIGKKSGIHTLSNKQLQEYNNRLNLEQNTKRLTFQDKSAGKRFVLTLLGKGSKSATETLAREAVNPKKLRRRMATGAAAIALA